MAFRYSLQPLLRLRLSLERQEEQRLFAIAALVARLRADIDQLELDSLEARRAELAELAEAGIGSGSSIQFAAICREALAAVRKKMALELQEAEHKRLQQLKVYQAVRQKREILEGLRERQEAAYELEFARREQQTADEIFLIRGFLSSNE